MQSDLRPCPFCGKPAVYYDNEARTHARCPDDDCAGRVSWMPVAMWNRRPLQSLGGSPDSGARVDWFEARKDVAALSGYPAMAISWSEHLARIRNKLEGAGSPKGSMPVGDGEFVAEMMKAGTPVEAPGEASPRTEPVPGVASLEFSTQEGRVKVLFPVAMDEGKLSLALLEAADFLVAPSVEITSDEQLEAPTAQRAPKAASAVGSKSGIPVTGIPKSQDQSHLAHSEQISPPALPVPQAAGRECCGKPMRALAGPGYYDCLICGRISDKVVESPAPEAGELEQFRKEQPIFDALMIELRGSWPQYEHYRNLLNKARGFQPAPEKGSAK